MTATTTTPRSAYTIADFERIAASICEARDRARLEAARLASLRRQR